MKQTTIFVLSFGAKRTRTLLPSTTSSLGSWAWTWARKSYQQKQQQGIASIASSSTLIEQKTETSWKWMAPPVGSSDVIIFLKEGNACKIVDTIILPGVYVTVPCVMFAQETCHLC